MPPTLPHRRFGRTNLHVSEVGLGGARLLGRRGDLPIEHGVATIRRALELGINYLDTAECYIGGRSEDIFGAALAGYPANHTHDQANSRPDSHPGNHPANYVLATKFGHRPKDFDWSRAAVVASVEESLRRLRRPHFDLLQIHTPAEPPLDAIFGPGGALDGMREVRDRGLCKWFGINGRHLDFLRRCVETDHFETLLVFQRFDLLEQSALPLLKEARAHDMGTILGSPLRLGLFGSARDELVGRLGDEDRRQLEALESLLSPHPGGVPAAAIRFALSPPEVSVILSGASSPEEIESAIHAALAPPLPPDLLNEIHHLGAGQERPLR